MTVLEQLSAFITDADGRIARNKWLSDDKMQVYIRCGRHMLDGKLRTCLDIASITVYEQRKGTFTDFVFKAHAMHSWDCTYVESVLNDFLPTWLLRNGFAPTLLGSFYLPKNPETWYNR